MSIASDQRVNIAHSDQFYIDGAWVTPSSTSAFAITDSATEEVFLNAAEAQRADMDRAITAARTAFDEGPWPRLSHVERAGYLRELGRVARGRSDDAAEIWTRQTGILIPLAQGGARHAATIFDYYADLAESFPFEEQMAPSAGGSFGLLVREPVGVVGAIIGWNGPFSQILAKLAPALLAGCTAIVKASPDAPGEAYLLAEIVAEVGLPAGVFNMVTADRDVSEMLARDPRVDKIAFTGSTAVGRRIASLMGERIGRYTLELGGKSAAVILDDADIAEAAAVLATSEVLLAGQVCTSLTRIIVGRNRQDELLDALAAEFAAIRVGDPFDLQTGMGPLATSRQRERVEGFIAKGAAEGADLVVGGGRPSHLDRGYYIEPTLFGNVHSASTIAQEEIFGPVLSVIPANSENDAVDIANDTIYGLVASVFTKDADRALAIAGRLRAGTVGHNERRADDKIAFGGFKQSGLGREGGKEGILPYVEVKTIILDETPTAYRSNALS